MSIVLFRVDERLIHGQVIVGWANELRPNRIIVVDDDLAESTWEQELYAMGLPEELTTSFESVADARAQLADWRTGSPRVLVLTRDVGTMRRLASAGAFLLAANLAAPAQVSDVAVAPEAQRGARQEELEKVQAEQKRNADIAAKLKAELDAIGEDRRRKRRGARGGSRSR
jgi:mannose/fructose/N-acetylgalactosamine-specific phosphotransferase system component IIB